MTYVDGFVLLVPKSKLSAYKKMARDAGKVWMKHGALQYFECVGDDLRVAKGLLSFPKLTKKKPNEVVVFSFIVYTSKAQRDRINKKIMTDPKMKEMCNEDAMPFEMKKMSYGGFSTLVNF